MGSDSCPEKLSRLDFFKFWNAFTTQSITPCILHHTSLDTHFELNSISMRALLRAISPSFRLSLSLPGGSFSFTFPILQIISSSHWHVQSLDSSGRISCPLVNPFFPSYPLLHLCYPLVTPLLILCYPFVAPLLHLCYPLVTPVVEFGQQAELPPPVPEALGGALTATFLILMTTGEGEGIVGRGGMKGFPEPNFKANWENGWGWRLFAIPYCATSKWAKLANNEKEIVCTCTNIENIVDISSEPYNTVSVHFFDFPSNFAFACWCMTGKVCHSVWRMTICRHQGNENDNDRS